MAQVARTLLLESLRKYPDNIAIECANNQLSYQELLEPVLTIQQTLLDLIGNQITIGVLADKTLCGYQCIAAAFLSGKAYVPLNVRYPAERNIEIIRQSGLQWLLVDDSCRDKAVQLYQHFEGRVGLLILQSEELGFVGHELMLPSLEERHQETEQCTVEAFQNEIAYLMFTSGSTGSPKGVPVTDKNIEAYIRQIGQCFDFTPQDRFSQFFDFTFDLSMHDLLVCWANGACLCAPDKMAMLMPLQFAQRKKLTVWFSVPSLALTAKDLLRKRFIEFRLEDIRYSLFCGEALPQLLAKEWSQITQQAPVVNLYGPTEATIAFTQHNYKQENDMDQPVVSIGNPIGDNQVTVLDSDGRELSHGELCLGGDQVFVGYWQRDDLTEDAFHILESDEGTKTYWYRTGDIVSRSQNGELRFHGRNDGQVQVMGFRVELQEVEQVLRELSGEGTLAVIPYPLNDVGEPVGLTAFVRDTFEDIDALKSSCEQRLPHYMVPREFRKINDFPYNASGKLDHRELKRIAENEL